MDKVDRKIMEVMGKGGRKIMAVMDRGGGHSKWFRRREITSLRGKIKSSLRQETSSRYRCHPRLKDKHQREASHQEEDLTIRGI